MDIDNLVKVIAVALVLAHIAVLIATLWFHARAGWVAGLNLLVSAGVLLYWLPRFSELSGDAGPVQAFVGFEFAVLIVSVLAVAHLRMPPAIHWIAFAANALLSVNALVFMLTFRITRLM